MRQLILDKLEQIWDESIDALLDMSLHDAHLMEDEELLKLFTTVVEIGPGPADERKTAAKYREELKRLYGVERPFICGTVGEKGLDNMHEYVLVCPMYGADGFAIYKKHKDYSAPGY
jgi:hypothetical protein